jgi:hypothetical protein
MRVHQLFMKTADDYKSVSALMVAVDHSREQERCDFPASRRHGPDRAFVIPSLLMRALCAAPKQHARTINLHSQAFSNKKED